MATSQLFATWVVAVTAVVGAAAQVGTPGSTPPVDRASQRPVVGAGDPSMGPASAPVTIVEFADFECPFCRRLSTTLAQVRERYGDRVRIVWKDFPLVRVHPHAFRAAVAARCALEQGRFWEYHDRLFANQQALDSTDLERYARDVGLNLSRFSSCVGSDRYDAAVQEAIAAAVRLGITATPTAFVNARMIRGAKPFDVFVAAVDEELARIGRR